MLLSLILGAAAAQPAARVAGAQTQTSAYPAMASIDRYLMASQAAEIALARSAAPPAISAHADVMVLGRSGFTTVAKGSNGFVCLVERAWDAPSADPQFWNPRIRGPNCFNPAAARSYLPIILMRTRLFLAGKSKAEVMQTVSSKLDTRQLPALEPNAMCYMLSRQQYVNDNAHAWHPHLMFFVPGNSASAWGANGDGVPVIATSDPDDRLTIMLVPVGHWSDGTPGGAM